MKWQKIFPDLGARSAEITILRVDPTTQATQLMIRVPKSFSPSRCALDIVPLTDPEAAKPPKDETKKTAPAVAGAIAPPGLEPGLS
jgi:hypothetical protein